MQRRHFVAGTVAGVAGGALAAPAIAQGRHQWNMVMPWPRNTPGVGTGAQRFVDDVNIMSEGRLDITLFAAGELVPPFESLDAVQQGAADMAHGTPYYWVGKSKALNYFTTIPFGLSATELAAWLEFGDGKKLWEEVYAPFGVKPFYAGSSGVQAGGWFRDPIETVEDLSGLKFRIAGLGGEVMRRLGVNVVLLPPGEIMPALTSGAIDAAEWIGPWNDRAFGLYRVAKYYYVPAFHEPGPGLEIIVNRAKYEALPKDLQKIIEVAAAATAHRTLADFTFHNIVTLDPLLAEQGVEIR
ncbi:MAG: TRAP transporter substrate-binding protein, partial [Geminicoccales bacterium]